MQQKKLVLFFLVVCVSAVLSFARLDNTSLWSDEAFVGITARNYLETGKLTCWDGRNFYAAYNGIFIDKNFRNGNSPLDTLITSVSFRIFGITTWAARFPFVLIGLIGLVVFGALLWDNFRDQTALCFYCLSSLALSMNFILNIRTCRYYALSLTFSLLAFYAYQRFIKSHRLVDLGVLITSLVLLFFSHFMLFGAFLAALLLVHFVRHANALGRRDWYKIAGVAFIACVIIVGYLLRYPLLPFHVDDGNQPWLLHHVALLFRNFRELNRINAMPWVCLVGLVAIVTHPKMSDTLIKNAVKEYSLLASGYILFLSLLSSQPTTGNTIADVRYLIPIFPFLLVLVGLFFYCIHGLTKLGAFIVFLIFVNTNLLTLVPQTNAQDLPPDGHFRWLLPAYLRECTAPYPTAFAEVSQYLRNNASQDDTIASVPEVFNYPIMFYIGNNIRICCSLDDNSPLSHEIIQPLHAPLYLNENFPVWLVCYTMNDEQKDAIRFFSRSHLENGSTVTYRYHLEKIILVNGRESQRPELMLHAFGPVKNFDAAADAVYIYKRMPDSRP